MSKFPPLTEDEVGLYLMQEHENFWRPPQPRPIKEVIGDWMDDHPLLFKLLLLILFVGFVVLCFAVDWLGFLVILCIPVGAILFLIWTLVNEASEAIRGWFY